MATEEIAQQLKEIEGYKKEGKSTLIFLCDPWHLPEFHRLIIDKVTLTADDIYQPPGSKKMAIHLAALERLGNIAGIEWIPSVTGAKTTTSTIIHYIATGFYVREYGKRVSIQGEGMTDLDLIKDDLKDQYTAAAKKYNKDKEYVDFCINRDYRAKRKKRLQLAAAEARAQVYRKLLGLGGTYEKAVFNHPIIIVRCVVAPDYKDPVTMKMLREASINAALGIYGENAGNQLGLPAPENGISEDGDYTGADTETIVPEPGDIEIDGPGDDTPIDFSDAEAQRYDFEQLEPSRQVKELSNLISRKSYSLPEGVTIPMVMAKNQQMKLYDKLMSMEDSDIDF